MTVTDIWSMAGSIGRPIHIFNANVLNSAPHTASAPSGRAWIVTDIDVFFTGSVAGGTLNIELTSTRTFYSKNLTAGAPSESDHWSGFKVLQPGEYFIINVGNGPYDVTIDGWEVPWANV